MKKLILMCLIPVLLVTVSCKKKPKDPEPGYILQKWSKAIEKLDYKSYSSCEAYPKNESTFMEMYRDDYFTDIMTVVIGEPEKDRVLKDYNGNSYIRRSIDFDGAAVKRGKKEPYQIVRGNIEFIRFTDGDKSRNGWLMSNRTITRINK